MLLSYLFTYYLSASLRYLSINFCFPCLSYHLFWPNRPGFFINHLLCTYLAFCKLFSLFFTSPHQISKMDICWWGNQRPQHVRHCCSLWDKDKSCPWLDPSVFKLMEAQHNQNVVNINFLYLYAESNKVQMSYERCIVNTRQQPRDLHKEMSGHKTHIPFNRWLRMASCCSSQVL